MARPEAAPAAAPGWIRPGETRLWIAAYAIVAVLLAVTGFASDDPDSALHANLSARLADGPSTRWIAPEWWGNWDSHGLYREHPVGVLLLPTVLAAIGVPAIPASYIVGTAAGLAALLLIGWLVRAAAGDRSARAAVVLLQLMPVAFLFRIRANHEYPMLVCLLLVLVGLERLQRSWWWTVPVAGAFTAALLIKGVFVVIVAAGAGVWVLIDPLGTRRSWIRPIGAAVVSMAAMALAAWLYDAWYMRITGESFWYGYWQRQLAPLSVATPTENAGMLWRHVGFYLSRLIWHPAPWSLALLAAAWRLRGRFRAAWSALPPTVKRGLLFCLLFAAAAVVILSPASRFAERYTFSAHFAIATAGAVTAYRAFPGFSRRFDRLDGAVPALPIVLWTGLMLVRLVLGPYLPRIS